MSRAQRRYKCDLDKTVLREIPFQVGEYVFKDVPNWPQLHKLHNASGGHYIEKMVYGEMLWIQSGG